MYGTRGNFEVFVGGILELIGKVVILNLHCEKVGRKTKFGRRVVQSI
jgi:hypothetical protein